jgi:hypothetical protein
MAKNLYYGLDGVMRRSIMGWSRLASGFRYMRYVKSTQNLLLMLKY